MLERFLQPLSQPISPQQWRLPLPLLLPVILVTIVICSVYGWQQVPVLDLAQQKLLILNQRCLFEPHRQSPLFQVYVPTKGLAEQTLAGICHNQVLQKQYAGVEVHWGYPSGDTLDFLGKGLADLTLTKANMMQAIMAASSHQYQPLVQYPQYSAYFISMKEKPQLSKTYFLDKRIGLLSHSTSRSGHMLPKKAFSDLGLDIQGLQIRYASSHFELRELLASDQVDLIASYWKDSDQQQFSKNYITAIEHQVQGGIWYMKLMQQNYDLYCALQSSLLTLSQTMGGYYQQAQASQLTNKPLACSDSAPKTTPFNTGIATNANTDSAINNIDSAINSETDKTDTAAMPRMAP